ncbi:hypothetical protein SAMN05421770_104117 [Granulicella rosea]|uniref:Uncharacterized protein n=1 Tax=Granulicella rosea TaxID=474952 RepID=A0A239JUJ0_9BACT|nr:hypothetical protein [Granulicella rosea]SNT09043.1 hypothetical protein SAMN05421770_104117 [Granulicella rosea]
MNHAEQIEFAHDLRSIGYNGQTLFAREVDDDIPEADEDIDEDDLDEDDDLEDDEDYDDEDEDDEEEDDEEDEA